MYILTKKIALLRPYFSQQIPCSLLNCQIDREQFHSSLKYFPSLSTPPVREISASDINNASGWQKLEGTIADISEHYVFTIKRSDNSKEFEVWLYHLGQFGIKKVFNQTINTEQAEFSKQKKLQGFTDIETSLWKENAQATEIYKLLSGCLVAPSTGDNNVFEPAEKDIT